MQWNYIHPQWLGFIHLYFKQKVLTKIILKSQWYLYFGVLLIILHYSVVGDLVISINTRLKLVTMRRIKTMIGL